MKYYVLSSGSKGNATIIESNGHVIQIDMGISLRQLNCRLQKTPFVFPSIEALLITHDHTDHASNAFRFEPDKIFASEGTYYKTPAKNFLQYYQTYNIANFKVTVLPVSHDAVAAIGFIIESEGEKLIYMTDTGYISERNLLHMQNPDYIIIESNHDVEMLWKTARPARLIMRILGDRGHLSNHDSANFISDIIGNRTKEITLAHLSLEANSKDVALATYQDVLKRKGIDISHINIIVASQHDVVSGGDLSWILK